jgi:HlyD family secretion protein/macrolide-specific efflux system membrane fusion protein
MRFLGKIRGLLILLILAGVAAWLFQNGKIKPLMQMAGSVFGDKKASKPQVKDFEFKPVIRRDIHQKVNATGTVTLKTGAEVKIGARISGKLERLPVRIGQKVRKGDLIASIEHEDLLARVSRFQADLNAELARLNKTSREGPLLINKDRAGLEELEVQVQLAEKMLERNTELNERGVVSTTVVDQAQERVEVLSAKIKLAGHELILEEMRLENNIKLAEAMVERAEANLREEEILLGYANITAPIDGVVAFISTQKGETVVAGMSAPTFVTLIDLSMLEVTVFVDETDIGRIEIGQNAIFTVDTYPEKFFDGVVRDIHPKAVIKDNVVNYEVLLNIDRKYISSLRPEMTANVVVTTGTRKNVLAIPKEAVKRTAKNKFAMINVNGLMMEKPIETGWREEGYIEIKSGLNDTEEVGIPIKPKDDKRKKRRRR